MTDTELILIVEDEAKLAQILADYLAAAGYPTHQLADGRAVAPWVRAHAPALILLDLLLPGRDGLISAARSAASAGFLSSWSPPGGGNRPPAGAGTRRRRLYLQALQPAGGGGAGQGGIAAHGAGQRAATGAADAGWGKPAGARRRPGNRVDGGGVRPAADPVCGARAISPVAG